MNTQSKPVAVSCILAVNRLDEHLDKAVQSILLQTFKDFELIIIANNCKDELWDYLVKLSTKDDRIIIKRTRIGQLVFNLNYGLNLARGKYIARMDADDISMPLRFEKQYTFLEDNPNVNILATNFIRINTSDIEISAPIVTTFNDKQIRKKLQTSNPIAHPSLMFRTEELLRNKGYAWSFWGEDYEYHLRCSRDPDYQFHCLEEVLLKYRISDQQMTASNSSINSYADECALLYREWLITGRYVYLLRILRLNRTLSKCYRQFIRVFRSGFDKKSD